MAKDKKSFILYADFIHAFEGLEDDEAGRLIKHILRYVNDLNPECPDKITKVAFEPIKQQLKRDLIKYEGIRGFRAEIGKIGGLKSAEAKRSKAKQNEANACLLEANQAVNDNVTVNVNDSYYNSCLVDQKWIDVVCMQNKIKVSEIKEWLDKFILRTITDGVNHNNLSDFKSHFNNWLKKQNKTPNQRPMVY